jgi:hypothetical protein
MGDDVFVLRIQVPVRRSEMQDLSTYLIDLKQQSRAGRYSLLKLRAVTNLSMKGNVNIVLQLLELVL